MSTKLPGLPTPPSNLAPEVQRYLKAVSEILEIRLGVRGNPQDRAITLRELVDAGVVEEAPASTFDVQNINAANRGFDMKYRGLLHTDENKSKLGVNTDQPTQALDVEGDSIRLRQTRTPPTAVSLGEKGQIIWDSSYIYVCVATNTWKRAGLSSWT